MRVIYVCIFLALSIISTYAFRPPDVPQLSNFDIRDSQKEIVSSQPRTNILKQSLATKELSVKYDKSLGSPVWIRNPKGFLNASTSNNSSTNSTKKVVQPNQIQIIKEFVDSNKELFHHGSELFTNFVTQYDYVTTHNKVRTIIYQQVFKGIRIFNAKFTAHIDSDCRIASISSLCIPFPESANLNNNQKNLVDLLTPQISVEQALHLAAENIGCKIIDPAIIKQKHNNQYTLTCSGIRGESTAECVWFPFSDKRMNLAYEIILTSRINKETYRVIVDANSGDVLFRQGLTKYFGDATYRVYTNESPTPMNPGFSYPITNQPPIVDRALITLSALNTNASPIGWVYTNLNQTSGNNADAYLDINADDLPDTPIINGSPQCVFDFPLDLSKSPYEYSNASVVNLFYWVNFAHDKFYELGFTEETGNFQNDNFGKSGFGNDALKAEAQDGDGYNNSNMTTPPDGNSPRMQMFIFTGASPYRDGSLDAEVILHEFTHGVSDRLVGGGAGLSTLQALGMGEGWSDFFAIALICKPTDDIAGNYPMAPYVTYLFNNIRENYYYGMRRYPYSTNMNVNPLTFKDIDPTQASQHVGVPRNSRIGGGANEIHNVGEIWCSALWDLRAELINKYGFYQGNTIALQLVIDGMKYSTMNPNFLEERDSILLADRLTNNGNNQKEIWKAFAKRGMGFFATSPDSDTSTGIVEDFSMPDDLIISPTSGFSSAGGIGGPFTPSTFSLVLTNAGSETINWRASCDGLVELSQYNGVLQPSGSPSLINISFNSAVVLLQSGIYESKLYITNLSSGITQTRIIKLLIGQKDYFIEMFDSYDNDLDFMSVVFTPDGSPSFYKICKETVTDFPTDPAGGHPVSLNDDTRVQVVLPNDMHVQIYGVRTNAIWIGANGEVSLAQGDTSYFYPQLTAFYEYPRVAPLYVDLNPATGGTVSYKIMPDRIAVTWENVPEYGRSNRNSFQAELFTNGVIKITWLNIETLGGVAGLSPGAGVPQGLVESDFSNYPQCGNSLKIFLPATAKEGDGTINDIGFVSIPVPSTNAINIRLISTDTAKLIVPDSITINPGSTSAVFDITIVDNNLIDGTQYPQVIAQSDNFTYAARSIAIFDNETNSISLKLINTISESDKRLTGDVCLSQPSARAIALDLYSDRPDIIQFSDSSFLFIPAGKTNATFNATVIDDNYINGDRAVVIAAKMTNWISNPSTVIVRDDEGTNIILILPQQISEGYGYVQDIGLILLEGLVETNLTVFLHSDNTNKIQVPNSITILQNDTEAYFDIFVPDNNILDGTQIATISATASGFSSATSQVSVIDNELPIIPYQPEPTDNSQNIPLTTTLKWYSGQGEQIVNGDFEKGTLNGWTTEDDGFGTWMLSDGTLNSGTYGEFPKLSGKYSVWLVQFGFGTHRLWQKVFIPDTVTEATLTWNHIVMNQSGIYNSNNYFRAEILDNSNQVIKVIYSTDTNAPTMFQWISNKVDISQYRGKTIKIAFTEKDTEGNIFVGIDNVSLVLNPPIVPVYDIFLGTNANPQTMQLIATTITNSLSISNLLPTTTYYWRIVSRYESAQVSSPIWNFTTTGTNILPEIKITSPASFSILQTLGSVPIICQTNDTGQNIDVVEIFINSNKIARLTAPPYQTLWTNTYPGKYTITALAIDKNGLTNYSSPVEIFIGLGGKTTVNLISKNSLWRYLDDGSNQGTLWRGYYFDDSNWNQGRAPLGYGFGNESTVLNYGIDYNNKFITYYFRSDFTVNYYLEALIFKLRRDDGAVVYINGYENLRDNMPSTTISYNTPALSPTTGNDQFRYFTYTVTNVFLIYGKNIVAVEVHQSSPDSTDLIFDMEVSAFGNYPPTINLKYPSNDIIVPYNRPLTIEADAYDKYGHISKVEFYNDSVKIGEATSAPYQITIPKPPIGIMAINARAVDNLGAASSTGTSIVYVVPVAFSNYYIRQNGLVLEWNTNFNAILEMTTNISSGQWLHITNQILKTNDLNYIVLPYMYPQQYFRLKAE